MPRLELETRGVGVAASPKRIVFVDAGSIEQIEFEWNPRRNWRERPVEGTFAQDGAPVSNFAEGFEPEAFESILADCCRRPSPDRCRHYYIGSSLDSSK